MEKADIPKESPRIDTAYKDLKTTKNLENYIQWFNRLSYMVATEVCMHVKKKQRVRLIEYWIEVGRECYNPSLFYPQHVKKKQRVRLIEYWIEHVKKKQRVRLIEYWIEVGRECFNTGNFNSLMAIIAGLNMSPVARLKKTWSRVDSAQLSVLEQQMSPSSNFLSYRRTLQAAMWRSSNSDTGSDGRQRIVIPFFSLLVKDLLVDGHINFEKFWQLAKQVTEFIAWKQVTSLWLASYDCEHPENSFEKDRLKVLKSENGTP
ncbi:Ras-GEF domain-containing family member 1B [Amphibalanus amphitrite]|uniref:Ras-GEF domain-containing family member 1B n=1 Tax=Amphibalanus amphitrite TaxID=1232801 RepID=A0A6A4W8U8_AMPAM|nr:Ras-GEF domain-containing family member 1B [Amphibalanus amphitrite]